MFCWPFLCALAVAAVLLAATGEARGHGGGSDTAPPINIAGMNVTVNTQMSPSDITVGDLDSANMKIRFFDEKTNSTLEKVTYRVEVFRGDEMLAREGFFADDGVLDIKIKPVYDCAEVELWKCSTYYGTEHPTVPKALWDLHGLVINGPIFDKGGLYNIRVNIEGATSERVLVTEVLTFETFVSVAQEQLFSIQTAEAAVPVVVKTYYDDVEDFEYDPEDDSVSFTMPFDWSPDYVENVALVHEEIRFPKEFYPYAGDREFVGYVDGIEVDRRVLLMDKYSFEDRNILHFTVSNSELQRINEILGPEHERNTEMKFKIIPQADSVAQATDFYLVDASTGEPVGSTVGIAWDSAYGAGESVPFEIRFHDENGDLLKDVRYALFLFDADGETILERGTEMYDSAEIGIFALEGIDIQEIVLSDAGTYRMDVLLWGTGSDYIQTYSGIGSAIIEIGEGEVPQPVETGDADGEIPSWIKSSVGFWVDGFTSDGEFTGAIEYLIENDVITVPPTAEGESSDGEIPSWIKSSAGFWVDGFTSDGEFISALQFLIGKGIIRVG